MLRHLLRVEGDVPLLIVAIYRHTEREADLLDLLADLRREHFFETIRLGGLGEQESSELVAALSDRPIANDDDRRLWLETKGNPFFLEEIVRHMAGGGVDVTSIPDGVRAVIRRRLARRSDDVRRVLAVGAVVGQEFSIEVVEQVEDLADASSDRLYDALDEAVAAQLIDEVPAQTAGGSSSRTASCGRRSSRTSRWPGVRGCTSTSARRSRRSHSDDEPARLAELAYHFLAAPPSRAAEKAIHYAIKAGQEATRMLAFEEAERLYTRALAAMERHGADGAGRRAVLLALGHVQIKLAETDAGRATFAHALALARDADDAQSFALAALGLGTRSFMAGGVVDEELIALLEEALERLPAVDSPLRARLFGRLATELSFSDRREECESLSEQAVAIARRIDDPGAYSFALTSRHWCLWGPENLKDRLAAARELLALGERTTQKTVVVEGHRWCMLNLLELGDIPAVDVEIDAYARLARERRLASEQWYVHMLRAMRMLLDGRLADVERTANEALRLGRRVQPANAEQSHTLQMVALRREQGRLAEMEARSATEPVDIRPYRDGDACRHGSTPKSGARRTPWPNSTRLPRRTSAISRTTASGSERIAFLAETCAAVGARQHAATLYEQLKPYSDRTAVAGWAPTCAGSVARHLGLLAAMLGRREAAAAHFEYAIAKNGEMGARLWVGRTQLQYAQALLRDPHAGDEERARRMLQGALVIARELELQQLTEELTNTLRLAGTRPATAVAATG